MKKYVCLSCFVAVVVIPIKTVSNIEIIFVIVFPTETQS